VVAKDGTLEERKVAVGMRTSSRAEIQSGLSEGELVVIGDRAGLTSGMAVTPKVVDSPASD
jgi:multidrug efflux pump subunit AcrA (membrane-fusion protein)